MEGTNGKKPGLERLRPPPETVHPEGSIEAAYERFAAGIVRMAIMDYSSALTGMLQAETRAVRKHYIDSKREVERFLTSPWFEMICSLDPYAIMTALEERAVEKELRSAERDLRSALRKYDASHGRRKK